MIWEVSQRSEVPWRSEAWTVPKLQSTRIVSKSAFKGSQADSTIHSQMVKVEPAFVWHCLNKKKLTNYNKLKFTWTRPGIQKKKYKQDSQLLLGNNGPWSMVHFKKWPTPLSNKVATCIFAQKQKWSNWQSFYFFFFTYPSAAHIRATLHELSSFFGLW